MRIPICAFLVVLISSLLLSGCINMSTPTAQVAPAQRSGVQYEDYNCARLVDELGALAKREVQLAAAHEKRVKASSAQALLVGVGQGDGAEADALANVRGDKEAVRKAMIAKQCGA